MRERLLQRNLNPKQSQAFTTCFFILFHASIHAGSLAINPLTGHLVDAYGWRNAFRIMCAYVISAAVIGVSIYREPDECEPGERNPNDEDEQNSNEKCEPGERKSNDVELQGSFKS